MSGPPFPTFIDLNELAAGLPSGSTRSQLQAMLKKAWKIQSCLGDLRQAEDCCLVLRDMFANQSKENSSFLTTTRALLTTAVILYVRATSGGAKHGERGSSQLDESKLESEQRADHNFLIEVRRKALAHVRSAEDVGNHVWHKELFFAIETGLGWQTASASNQTGFHADTLNRLERSVPVAVGVLKARFQNRMDAVTDCINKLGYTNEELKRFSFDPLIHFGTAETVWSVVNSRSQTSVSFWAE